MNIFKLIIVLISVSTCFAFAQNNPNDRLDVVSIGQIWNSQTDLPIGYDFCNGGKWQAHDTIISSVKRGAICIVNGMYSCHSFSLRQEGFDCELGALSVPIMPNGLPPTQKVYISHNDVESKDFQFFLKGLEHWETRNFSVGSCTFSINLTGNIFKIYSNDLAFETKFNPKTDRDSIRRTFYHGIEVTSESVAGVPFNRDCFAGL